MNLYTTTTTNKKGQLVIPKSIRGKLGIDSETLLSIMVRGNSIYICPVEDVIDRVNRENSYVKILQATKGSWGPFSARESNYGIKKRNFELSASAGRKKEW